LTIPGSPTGIGLLLLRVPIGAYFFIAGFGKIAGTGLSAFIARGMSVAPAGVPEPVMKGYLGALPFLEMIVGVLVAIGLFTRVASFVMSLMLVSFLVALGKGFAFDGSAEPFDKNIVFLGLTLSLVFAGGGRFSVDNVWGKSKSQK
jgi:putative oxidoreductase